MVASHAEAFVRVGKQHGVVNGSLAVPQIARDGRLVDAHHRFELGAALLRDLVAAGC